MIIVAKLTNDGKVHVGKREVKMYNIGSKVTDELIAHANVGLTLSSQRSIREAIAVKKGLKTVSTEGVKRDLSSIDSV